MSSFLDTFISTERTSADDLNNSRPACLPQMVSAQASITPDAIAVEHNGKVLTYAQLDSRAGELAGHLRALGAGPNVVVGLCLARSAAMIVGALGVLKAGGAYLPIDPDSPPARLAFQLQDAHVPILVTAQCLTERLPAGAWHVVGLNPDGGVVDSSNSASLVLPEVPASDLAYVIYTSGSTGQPKGVEITHASLENLITWHQQAFAVTARDRAGQQASSGFDAAVWEIWPYLTAGASVHIADNDTRNDPERFRDWLICNAITIAFAPTPMAEKLLELEWPATTALRILLTGADTLRRFPPANLPFSLVNNYGPTECTVVTTSGVVPPNVDSDQLPSIGRPITNVQVHILDEKLVPVPAGKPGELYIGGAGMARGYRNRPDLTAERFIENPFDRAPGSRLYRTGDRACCLPDGQIAFLGRSDDQVKIRGYRIELGEVDAALGRHPLIEAGVVVTCKDQHGDPQLAAYVVPRSGSQLTSTELRDFLLTYLPDYMAPTAFFRMDALPLAASGKVDRNALPPLQEAEPLEDARYVAPRSDVEALLSQLLCPLLHLERVGVEDNFFLIGGNSLLGAQVIARVRSVFGVELSLLSIFDNPTIAELAAVIERLLVAKVTAMSEGEAQRLASAPDTVSLS